jgi:DNA-cytosine methyltransferase
MVKKMKPKRNKYTVGGLFSGVGGIEQGFENNGFSISWANEFDPSACRTYRFNHKHTLIEKDIHELAGAELPSVDVLTAGFPCQAFSVAGYRKGFQDNRGNLFFQIMRLVDEFEEKPKVLFLENVKNFKGHDGGNTFKTVCKEIESRGYSIFTQVLNTADYTDIPHNRERIFIICFRDERLWDLESSASCSRTFSSLFPPEKSANRKHIRTDNTQVVIENQLERTDHTHLGQLLTYAAGLDAVTLVWIVERFREDHRAALDWLNLITDEGFHFFGLEIELWQIGSSVPAPKFNVVAKPNDWSKTVKDVSQGKKSLTQIEQTRFDYWTSFGEFVSPNSTSVRPPKPSSSYWMGYGGLGRSDAGVVVWLRQGHALVNLQINSRNHPDWFHLLLEQRDAVESQLDLKLDWKENAGLKYSVIEARLDVDSHNRKEWPRIHAWMLDGIENFRRVFKPFVQDLDDSSWSPPEDAD